MKIKEHKNYICFEFNNNWYLYERIANTIHKGTKEEIERLAKIVENIKYSPSFESKSLEKRVCASIDCLVFNITESCNLACDYCIYSGKYSGERTTNNNKMSFEVAKRALDLFLFKTSEPSFISFYGGEPLMNFPVIERIVNYSKKIDPQRKKIFSIATNLVNAERYIDYLIENQFYIQISLDGPKEVHDKYRTDKRGHPTFDIVQKNIEKINAKKEGYTKTYVSLSATYKNPEDFDKIIEYFMQMDDQFAAMRIGFVETKGLKEKNIESIKLKDLIRYVQKYVAFLTEKKEPPKILKFLFEQKIQNIQKRPQEKLPKKLPLNGACYPGKRKLFIDINGGLYTCEKIEGKLSLGDIYAGINFDSTKSYVDQLKEIRNILCKDCWAARICSACLMSAKDPWKGISAEGLSETCNASKGQLIASIIGYTLIKDNEKENHAYQN